MERGSNGIEFLTGFQTETLNGFVVQIFRQQAVFQFLELFHLFQLLADIAFVFDLDIHLFPYRGRQFGAFLIQGRQFFIIQFGTFDEVCQFHAGLDGGTAVLFQQFQCFFGRSDGQGFHPFDFCFCLAFFFQQCFVAFIRNESGFMTDGGQSAGLRYPDGEADGIPRGMSSYGKALCCLC